uniref:Uncharacterized protein n=1 Tax=Caulobacter sp. (strain K31) TaxID=366602 RepID=B0T988_CAUSK
MSQPDLDLIWNQIKSGVYQGPALATTVEDADELQLADDRWRRVHGQTTWEPILPLAGNLA